jgi:hypothetical protein
MATALKRLMRIDSVLRERISLVVGLVCAQGKSAAFSDAVLLLSGAPESHSITRYRAKRSARPAWDFAYQVADPAELGHSQLAGWSEWVGALWTSGMFTPDVCNYCGDLFALDADIVGMDAWVRPYLEDWRGTSIIVARSQVARDLVDMLETRACVSRVEASLAKTSQAAAIRNKSVGLAYRLRLNGKSGRYSAHVQADHSLDGLSRHEALGIRARLAFASAGRALARRGLRRPSSRLFLRVCLHLAKGLEAYEKARARVHRFARGSAS